MNTNLIYRGDCYTVLKRHFPAECVDLVYVDPPFSFDPKYARLWYDKETLEVFEEIRRGDVKHYISWISKRLEQCQRALKDEGSIYLHCDWKFGHYLKVEMDNIFGKNNFQNEIIWRYYQGGKSQRRFGRKHDTIFFYTKTGRWSFNPDPIRIPYAESTIERYKTPLQDGKLHKLNPLGQIPSDVWTDIHSISRSAKERVGYPTQKPERLLERIILASSEKGDVVLDPFCGCGTTIVVAHELGRRWVGIDISTQACEVMKERMEGLEGITEVEIIGLPLTAKDLRKVGAFEFQDYICEMTNSEKRKHVGDEGIDGYYLGEIPLQIKQQEKVGRNTVDNFETALRRKNKAKGYVIGFSFTKGAYEEAARAKDDGLEIKLVGVDELIKNDYELA